MTIETCNSYNEDEMYTQRVEFSVQTTWNHHQVEPKAGEDFSSLVKGYQPEGWGKLKTQVKPMDVSGSGTIKVTAEWGGKDGPTVTVGGSASINDDKGNYVEISVSQDSNGEGKTEVSATHEKGNDDK